MSGLRRLSDIQVGERLSDIQVGGLGLSRRVWQCGRLRLDCASNTPAGPDMCYQTSVLIICRALEAQPRQHIQEVPELNNSFIAHRDALHEHSVHYHYHEVNPSEWMQGLVSMMTIAG